MAIVDSRNARLALMGFGQESLPDPDGVMGTLDRYMLLGLYVDPGEVSGGPMGDEAPVGITVIWDIT